MTVTHDPRFAVDVWGSGSDPWPGRLGFNELLGLITAGAVKGAQGISGDRPTAGIDRRLYLATDTKRLFWDTGSEWVEVSPVGGGPDTAAITVGGAYVAGSSRIAARSDHGHALAAPAVDPAAETFGATADRGASATPARADHRHAMPAMPLSAVPPVANAFGTAAVVGVSTNVARADHKHATPSMVKSVGSMLLGSEPSNLGDLRWATNQYVATTNGNGEVILATGHSNGVAFLHVNSVDGNGPGSLDFYMLISESGLPNARFVVRNAAGALFASSNVRINIIALGW